MIRTLRKLGIENFRKLIKAIYKKPTAHIIFNDERLNAKIGKKSRMNALTALFQNSSGNCNQGNKGRKENKRHMDEKGKIKIILYVQHNNNLCIKSQGNYKKSDKTNK